MPNTDRHRPLRRAPLPGRWRERVWLPDGRELCVRPPEPADAEPIRAGFHLLHPDEIRHRFGYTMKELPPAHVHRLTHPDPRTDFVLVAAEPLPAGDALVGAVARLAIDRAEHNAEFAILVSHFLAGQGLGRHLLRRLIQFARRARLRIIVGDVMSDNHPMLDLAGRLGFTQIGPDHDGMIRVELRL